MVVPLLTYTVQYKESSTAVNFSKLHYLTQTKTFMCVYMHVHVGVYMVWLDDQQQIISKVQEVEKKC